MSISSSDSVMRGELDAGSVARHAIDLVVLARPLGHLDAHAVTDVRGLDGLVLELHGPDLLREVRMRARNPNRVPHSQLSGRDVHDGYLGLAEVVRHRSYALLPHRPAPLGSESRLRLPKVCCTRGYCGARPTSS